MCEQIVKWKKNGRNNAKTKKLEVKIVEASRNTVRDSRGSCPFWFIARLPLGAVMKCSTTIEMCKKAFNKNDAIPEAHKRPKRTTLIHDSMMCL